MFRPLSVRRISTYVASAPQAIHHASVAVDLPRDARQHRLPEFRSILRDSPSHVDDTWRSSIGPARRFDVSLALNMYLGNISSSTDQKLDRMISMMEHLLSSGEVQVNPAMDSSYSHNYGRYEDSHYYNVNEVGMPQNRHQYINMNSFVEQVKVCEICGYYSHSAHNCPYHPQYENYHYSSHISPQPDFSGFMSYPQAPQHERNQQFHQSLSLDDMMMQVMESVPESWRTCNEVQNIYLTLPALKDVQTSFDRNSVGLQRKIDQAELCSTQPTFHPEEDVRDDTLTNLEVREDTKSEESVIETSEECEVFQIEPEIAITLNKGEDEMKIDVDSYMSEMPQIESEEDQLMVLVQPPTLPCTFGKPYKGVEVRERLQIFYTTDIFVLDEPNTIDSFVLEVPDELLNLKEGMHASLPNNVDAPFVVEISKGEGIT
ncbi:hypothetical protein Syun_000835 [Stephania yunnanensis]|uniref:Uncharacterized protein n=1 Tax=Stephania yunnanensis TaxID=152371 RepID=A0AAP0LDQ1_9MAGN